MMSSAIDMDVTPKQMSKGNLSGSQKWCFQKIC